MGRARRQDGGRGVEARASRWHALPILAILLAAPVPAAGGAGDDVVIEVGNLRLVNPWTKSSIGAHDATVYFEVQNKGAEAEVLTGASSSLATTVLLVREEKRADETVAVPMASVDIPAGAAVIFARRVGGIALRGLTEPLVMGKLVPVRLDFGRVGPVDIVAPVRFHPPGFDVREHLRRTRETGPSPAPGD